MTSTSIYQKDKFQILLQEKLGIPNDSTSLDKYFDLILSNDDSISYRENHHILPKCKFPEFINSDWNLVSLRYEDHVSAHKLLAIAYPINAFINPLRFMKSDITSEEYKKLRQLGAKRGWIDLKADTLKYLSWKYKKSKSQKEHMNKPENRYRWVHILKSNPEIEAKRQKNSNDSWTEDRRKKWSEYQKIVKNLPENKLKLSESLKVMWKNKSDEELKLFCETMKRVNNDIDKKERNSKTAKIQWQDEEFRNRMVIIRNEIKKTKIELGIEIKTNSAGLKAKWADPVWKANMLESRRLKKENRVKEGDTNGTN